MECLSSCTNDSTGSLVCRLFLDPPYVELVRRHLVGVEFHGRKTQLLSSYALWEA